MVSNTTQPAPPPQPLPYLFFPIERASHPLLASLHRHTQTHTHTNPRPTPRPCTSYPPPRHERSPSPPANQTRDMSLVPRQRRCSNGAKPAFAIDVCLYPDVCGAVDSGFGYGRVVDLDMYRVQTVHGGAFGVFVRGFWVSALIFLLWLGVGHGGAWRHGLFRISWKRETRSDVKMIYSFVCGVDVARHIQSSTEHCLVQV